MPLSIDNFRQKIGTLGGPAPVNRYEVWIPAVAGQSDSGRALLCEQAELPGKTILTVEDKLYGPVRKIGYGQMFIDTTMTFICTADGWEEKALFDGWQNYVVDPTMFDAKYYNQYARPIYLRTYNERNEMSYGIVFREAFPLNVGAINLGWSQNNEYARLSVTFAYRKWTPLTIEKGSVDMGRAVGGRQIAPGDGE